MRVVLDTDVIVAALRSPTGASAALIEHALDGDIALVLSVPLALEYEATCSLAEHRIAAGLKAAQVGRFLDGVIGIAEPVEVHFLWRPQLRDAGDEMVLETAVNGRVSAIVTFNLRDFGGVPTKFGIDVLRPAEALRRIRS
jgi:putative PIN family toxin of toxin-antitoxin system